MIEVGSSVYMQILQQNIVASSLISFNIYLFIYFERQIECEWGRSREREGDTESEAGSRLWAVSTEPDTGLELMNGEIMTWAEVWRSTHWATQVPLFNF